MITGGLIELKQSRRIIGIFIQETFYETDMLPKTDIKGISVGKIFFDIALRLLGRGKIDFL